VASTICRASTHLFNVLLHVDRERHCESKVPYPCSPTQYNNASQSSMSDHINLHEEHQLSPVHQPLNCHASDLHAHDCTHGVQPYQSMALHVRIELFHFCCLQSVIRCLALEIHVQAACCLLQYILSGLYIYLLHLRCDSHKIFRRC